MSASLSRSPQSDRPPPAAPSRLLSLVAATVLPFDGLLTGMVAAGQGVVAICLFLGLSRDTLDQSLIRLGLRTPHDRPLRKAGQRGWSTLDVIRLIAWRMAGVHPAVIAERLSSGDGPTRSVGAVRSKARRLGVPTPARKDLRRVDPATLVDPGPFSLQDGWAGQAQPCAYRNGPPTPSVVSAEPLVSRRAVVRPAGFAAPAAALSAAGRGGPAAKRTSQRELQLFRVMSAGDVAVPTVAPVVTAAPAAPAAELVVPPAASRATTASAGGVQAEPEAASSSDIAWVGRCRGIPTNEAAILALSMRYFGGQLWTHIAADAGIKIGALRTILSRAGLPRDTDRKKFGPTFDPEMAQATLDASGYRLERDRSSLRRDGKGMLFWKHRRDRGVTTCRASRFKSGALGEYDKYKSQEITLITRRDLEEPALDLDDTSDARRDAGSQKKPPTRPRPAVPFAERRATLLPSSNARVGA